VLLSLEHLSDEAEGVLPGPDQPAEEGPKHEYCSVGEFTEFWCYTSAHPTLCNEVLVAKQQMTGISLEILVGEDGLHVIWEVFVMNIFKSVITMSWNVDQIVMPMKLQT